MHHDYDITDNCDNDDYDQLSVYKKQDIYDNYTYCQCYTWDIQHLLVSYTVTYV